MASYALILDLDGTLAYTIDDIHTAVNGMLMRLGYKTRTKNDILKFINNGARELVRRSLPREVQASEMIVDSALATYEEEYAKCYMEKTYPYEGISEALTELKAETKVKLAVLSNKQDKFVKDIIAKFSRKSFLHSCVDKPLACQQSQTQARFCVFANGLALSLKAQLWLVTLTLI